MLDNPLLTTVGSLIGVSGSILSYIMCVAMNRSLTNVLFGGMGTAAPQETHKIEGSITKTTVEDTVDALANADSVILVSDRTFHHESMCNGISAFRSLATEWLWRKHNTQYRKYVPC